MKKLVVANWKMNPTSYNAAQDLVKGVLKGLKGVKGVDVVLAPPFIFLPLVREIVRRSSVELGAQDAFWQDVGPFTGEVSPAMLKNSGVRYVILGHSERRAHLGETDAMVAKKVRAVLDKGLHPIICVGEKSREEVEYKGRKVSGEVAVLSEQVPPVLKIIKRNEVRRLIFAYEPVWAIGTGKADKPQDALEAIMLIRRLIARRFGPKNAHAVRILYGGSVTPQNVASFVSQEGIDGVLVGGASLKSESFLEIVRVSETV